MGGSPTKSPTRTDEVKFHFTITNETNSKRGHLNEAQMKQSIIESLVATFGHGLISTDYTIQFTPSNEGHLMGTVHVSAHSSAVAKELRQELASELKVALLAAELNAHGLYV